MLRKLLCAIVVMSFSMGLVAADEITAIIKKVDGKNVTFSKFAFGKGKTDKAEDTTLPIAKGAKITNGKFNKEEKKIEAGDPIEKGLMNEMFTKLGEKKSEEKKTDEKKGKKGGFGGFGGGLFAQIVTSEDGKTITAIHVMNFAGKGKKKTDEKKTDK